MPEKLISQSAVGLKTASGSKPAAADASASATRFSTEDIQKSASTSTKASRENVSSAGLGTMPRKAELLLAADTAPHVSARRPAGQQQGQEPPRARPPGK